jgi:hypothetical protein
LLTNFKAEINIDESNIAHDGDKGNMFKRNKKNNIQWIDTENEHFMVWMRTSGLLGFRKLWGKINTNLPAGTYFL